MARHFTLKKVKALFKQGRPALIVLLLALVLLTVISVFWLRRSMSASISNPEDTVGNTAGNLNNGGTFCEYAETVYFSNPYDGGALYAMTPEEEEIRFLSPSSVQNLLAGGNHLYYFQTGVSGSGDISNIASTHGFNRSDLSGKRAKPLITDVIVAGQLVGDDLYLLSVGKQGIEFFKMRADRSGQKTSLANYTINPACAVDGTLYYNLASDSHYLYALDTDSGVPRRVLDISLWNPIVQGDYVYYMDVEHNYRLCRYSFSADAIEILTRDRVDCYNVGGGFVYYQKNSAEPQLICMRTDGTEKTAIAEGNYTQIQMTSRYVYFRKFGTGELFHSRIGSGVSSPFSAARDAIPPKK